MARVCDYDAMRVVDDQVYTERIMKESYLLEIDYEWREVGTHTVSEYFPSLLSAQIRIDYAKKEGKYEGHRLYKLTKELVENSLSEFVPTMG
jgi:hypothetical protein